MTTAKQTPKDAPAVDAVGIPLDRIVRSQSEYVDAVMRQVYAATSWDSRIAEIEAAVWAAVEGARLREQERLRGYFRDALADHGITWPGEVDILYDKCFAAPYVPDEDA
jgi:hypothetical protein